jgi:hypothetical protein
MWTLLAFYGVLGQQMRRLQLVWRVVSEHVENAMTIWRVACEGALRTLPMRERLDEGLD